MHFLVQELMKVKLWILWFQFWLIKDCNTPAGRDLECKFTFDRTCQTWPGFAGSVKSFKSTLDGFWNVYQLFTTGNNTKHLKPRVTLTLGSYYPCTWMWTLIGAIVTTRSFPLAKKWNDRVVTIVFTCRSAIFVGGSKNLFQCVGWCEGICMIFYFITAINKA